VETQTRSVPTSTRDTLELAATLEADEGDAPVHAERWARSGLTGDLRVLRACRARPMIPRKVAS
jgi:hypothetical protein